MSIPSGFRTWLADQEAREDLAGDLARAVAAGRRLDSPLIAHQVDQVRAEYRDLKWGAMRRQADSAPCPGCHESGGGLTVRSEAGTAHWHRQCFARSRSGPDARGGPASGLRTTIHD